MPVPPRRDFQGLARRRKQAARLFAAGKLILASIARELKVSRQSVTRWYREWQHGGASALRGAGRAGRKPKLQPSHLRQVDQALRQGARAHLGAERRDATVDSRIQLEEDVHLCRPRLSLGWSKLYFQTREGSYNTPSLVQFLKDLKRELRGPKAVLVWDGLPAHKSREMKAYLAPQHDWLVVERLPGYAPDLNPAETLWGNIKGQELANRCAPDLGEVHQAVKRGMARVRRSRRLPFSFLKHAGLSF